MKYLLFIFCCQLSYGRTALLTWKTNPSAISYEIQILNDMKLYTKSITKKNHWRVQLPPGIYQYQIRALDAEENPGEWSEAERLKVVLPPPALKGPENGLKQESGAPLSQFKASWSKVADASWYQFRLLKGDAVIATTRLKTNELLVQNLSPGTYLWMVQALYEPKSGKTVKSEFSPPFLVEIQPPKQPERKLLSETSPPQKTTATYETPLLDLKGAFSLAPYQYSTDALTTNLSERGGLLEIDMRARIQKHSCLFASFSDFVQDIEVPYHSKTIQVGLDYTLALSKSNNVTPWLAYGGLGVALQDWFHITPGFEDTVDPEIRKFSTLGTTMKLGIEKWVSESLSFGLFGDFQVPLTILNDTSSIKYKITSKSPQMRLKADIGLGLSKMIRLHSGGIFLSRKLTTTDPDTDLEQTISNNAYGAYLGLSLQY